MPQLDLVFDAIICDPPYGTTACAWDTVIPFEPLWENYKRLVKGNGAVVLFGSQPFTSKLVMSNLEWFRQEIIWNKGEGGNFANANKRILPAHENILLFSQKSPVYNPQFTDKPTENIRGARYDSSETVFYKNFQKVSSVNYKKDISYPISVIRFPSQAAECNSAHRLHPTQKPVALLAYLIRTYTNPGEIILDNAMGSGTTLLAAQNEGRRAIGIEISEEYCKIAVDRLRQPSFFSMPDKPKPEKPKQKALL
jgi:site-specific DNA-methyltransferase (adenine-specific)